jgi:hypothetical protein
MALKGGINSIFILLVKNCQFSINQKHFWGEGGLKMKQPHGVNRKRSKYTRFIHQGNTLHFFYDF